MTSQHKNGGYSVGTLYIATVFITDITEINIVIQNTCMPIVIITTDLICITHVNVTMYVMFTGVDTNV